MTIETDIAPDDQAVASHLESSLPGYYYLSPEMFEREKQRIFFREWYCVGREEQVPNTGDYLVVDVLGESVLIVRAKTGELNAFYNVCRHRGCRLALNDSPPPQDGDGPGCSGSFHNMIRCPYHSWSYNFEGELRGTPFLRESERFNKADFSLYPVGVDVWGGFLFLNLSPAEAKEDPQKVLNAACDTWLGTAPGGTEVRRYARDVDGHPAMDLFVETGGFQQNNLYVRVVIAGDRVYSVGVSGQIMTDHKHGDEFLD